MTDIHAIHDKTFKNAISDVRVARNFFEHYLPKQVLDFVDLTTLNLSSNSYVDEDLRAFSSDVLYHVDIKNQTDKAILYLLVEHQSSIDPLMPFRLWNYKVKIWADHLKQTESKTLPLIFPLVFYHGVRHEATEESCLRYLYGTRRPIVSPIESRIMNKELIRQCNEGLEIRGLTCKRQSLLVATTG